MRTGIFYEIGAAGLYLSYLLSEDWRQAADQEKREQFRPVYADYFADISDWDGYFIDPSPEVINAGLMANRGGHYFNMAIAATHRIEGVETFVLDEYHAKRLGLCSLANNTLFGDLPVHKTFYTSCVTLEALITFTGKVPDLLSIDIEGAEREVFENYSFRYRPRVLLVDHHDDFDYLVDILERHHYRILNSKLHSEELLAIDSTAEEYKKDKHST